MKTSSVVILADGTANVTASSLTVVDSGDIDAREHSVIFISESKISGGIRAHGKSLTVTDTKITGSGIDLDSDQLEVNLKNTTIENPSGPAIRGGARVFHMTGGELRNSQSGADLSGGTYTFTNVSIKRNREYGFSLIPGFGGGRDMVTMRGCTVSGNGTGVFLFFANGDFGTAASPGHNTFRDNEEVGLLSGRFGYPPPPTPPAISAVGNTWIPNTQGSDANGHYSSRVITGYERGLNFRLIGSDLQTLQL